MTLIFLEALGALVVLLLIVWWTMFSGRKRGELRVDETEHASENLKKKEPVRPTK